jgi:hypothetical protein
MVANSAHLKYWPASKGQTGTEDALQNACAMALDLKGIAYYHCPNGGKREFQINSKGKKYCIAGQQLKKAGVKAGVPDLIIVDKLLVVELKVGSNKPTPEQVWWLEKYLAIGWRAFWVNSIDEFLDLIGT